MIGVSGSFPGCPKAYGDLKGGSLFPSCSCITAASRREQPNLPARQVNLIPTEREEDVASLLDVHAAGSRLLDPTANILKAGGRRYIKDENATTPQHVCSRRSSFVVTCGKSWSATLCITTRENSNSMSIIFEVRFVCHPSSLMSSLVHPFEFRKVSDNRGFSKICHEKKLKSTLDRFLYVTETSEINSFSHSSNQEWSSETLIANISSTCIKEICVLNCDSILLILAASQIDQPPQVHRSEEMRWQTYSRRTPCVCRQNPPRPPDRRSSLSVAS